MYKKKNMDKSFWVKYFEGENKINKKQLYHNYLTNSDYKTVLTLRCQNMKKKNKNYHTHDLA